MSDVWHGNVGWPVPGRIVLDPETEELVVAPGDWDRKRSPDVEDHRSLLFKFLALGQAEPAEVLAFAETWGLLELCRHGVPWVHRRPDTPPRGPNPDSLLFRRGVGPNVFMAMDYGEPLCWHPGRGGPYREPIEDLRRFARQGSAVLSLAEKLRVHGAVAPEDWAPLDDPPVLPGVSFRDRFLPVERARDDAGRYSDQESLDRHRRVRGQQRAVATALNAWMSWGDVGPEVEWGLATEDQRDTLTTRLKGRGLFGALATALSLEASGRHSWATCINCGIQYIPKRTPREGEATYCPRLRCQKERNRDNVRRHREKNR